VKAKVPFAVPYKEPQLPRVVVPVLPEDRVMDRVKDPGMSTEVVAFT